MHTFQEKKVGFRAGGWVLNFNYIANLVKLITFYRIILTISNTEYVRYLVVWYRYFHRMYVWGQLIFNVMGCSKNGEKNLCVFKFVVGTASWLMIF